MTSEIFSLMKKEAADNTKKQCRINTSKQKRNDSIRVQRLKTAEHRYRRQV